MLEERNFSIAAAESPPTFQEYFDMIFAVMGTLLEAPEPGEDATTVESNDTKKSLSPKQTTQAVPGRQLQQVKVVVRWILCDEDSSPLA